jgi:hypothetical protein
MHVAHLIEGDGKRVRETGFEVARMHGMHPQTTAR